MELSLFLAQIVGVYFAVVGIAFILRPQWMKDIIGGVQGETFATFMLAFVALVVGTALVVSHNVWELSWRVLITLVGWGALIKGILFMWAPEWMRKIAQGVAECTLLKPGMYVVVLLGLWLMYIGFGGVMVM